MAEKKNTSNPAADLDQLIHAPARLSIMANLYVVESANFIFLRNLTGLTWGNLSAHVSKLVEAGYLEVDKSIVNKKTHTVARMTGDGRRAFEEYRNQMMEVLKK